MKKVSFVIEKLYQNNILFDKNQKKIFARDNAFAKYHVLYDVFKENSYDVATCDINSIEESDIVIYNDLPNKLPSKKDIEKSYLIMNESPLVRADNFDKSKHKYFHKIFTWNDNLVDDKKYIKINYSFSFPKEINKDTKRKKLCCLIVSNKSSNYKNELYSERIQLIEWFESHHLEDFSLYGIGWDSFRFQGVKAVRALNKLPFVKEIFYKLFKRKYKSYRGTVDSKFDTMKKYKFAIAYENVKDENGYITEKIFDVFIAGCVPIYLGAKNINEYIPSDCFIDRRKFDSNSEMYSYIKSMNDVKYLEYLNNIERYLNSKQSKQFTIETFAETIVKNILEKN